MNALRAVGVASLALLMAAADAAVLAYADALDGSGRFVLHDERGPCVGDAQRAEYVPVKGERVAGCWVVRGPVVWVVFFDSDTARIPVQLLREPAPA